MGRIVFESSSGQYFVADVRVDEYTHSSTRGGRIQCNASHPNLDTEAYQRRCAITGEKTLPVLDAAHILVVKTGLLR